MNKNNISGGDGWGEEPMTDTADESLWDEYAVPEDDSDPTVSPADGGEGNDLQALECEMEDALCKGDMDRADDVQAAIDDLMTKTAPASKQKTADKPRRKKKWVPPPQTALVEKGEQGDFKPKNDSWKKPEVVVDRSKPSVASSLKPLPAARRMQGPAPRRQFNKRPQKPVEEKPVEEKPEPVLPEGATLLKRKDDEVLVAPKQKPERKKQQGYTRVGTGPTTTTFAVDQVPWKQYKQIERRKYWQEKTKAAAETGDTQAKEVVERSKARESAFEKLESKSSDGAVKTQPCRAVMTGEKCKFGPRCRFAHKPEELNVRECHFKGQCRRKTTCKFGHPGDMEEKTKKARARMTAILAKV